MGIQWDGFVLKIVISYRRWILGKRFVEIFTEYGRSKNEAIENVVSKTIERSSILQANKLGTSQIKTKSKFTLMLQSTV